MGNNFVFMTLHKTDPPLCMLDGWSDSLCVIFFSSFSILVGKWSEGLRRSGAGRPRTASRLVMTFPCRVAWHLYGRMAP